MTQRMECKICGSRSLYIHAHTARCPRCGVLLYYPYPKADAASRPSRKRKARRRTEIWNWYSKSSFFNHANFTNMLRFAIDESHKERPLDILDYGGGGGQFALVCRSHFPRSTIYITDIDDEALLDEWRAVNNPIPFESFKNDEKRFDFIFLNDVFEHVSDPRGVLELLSSKLKDRGKIFIDTPKQFWIYPLTRWVSPPLYTKVLQGTVSSAHLQIWSKTAFQWVVRSARLKIVKYEEWSEYTMPADYYLGNMGIEHPLLRAAGRAFHANAKWLARNKIVCLLSKRERAR